MDMVHRAVGVAARSLNVEARTVDIVMSTDAIDSYNERVLQNWDLKRFKSNPVVLWSHNSRDLPIGKASNVRIVDGKLECTVTFASEKANPMAEQVLQLFAEDILKTSSVGFVPHSFKTQKEANGDEVTLLDQNELHELSIVCVPANPEALAKAINEHAAAHAIASKHSRAFRAAEEIAMEIKEAQSIIAARDAELINLKASLVGAETAITSERAAKAELEKTNAVSVAKVKALEVERDAATTKATEALATAKAANLSVVSSQLDALIGVKIDPSEKEGLVEVFELSPKTYEKQLASIKARPDLKTLGAVIPKDPEPVNKADDSIDSNGGDFAREASRRAAANAG